MVRLGAWWIPSRGHRVKRFGGLRSDSGITTLQVLMLFPIMMAIFDISLQMALNYYAKQVVLAAAQEGVNAVRYSGNPGLTATDEANAEVTARAAATAYLAKHGQSLVRNLKFQMPFTAPPGPFGIGTSQIRIRISANSVSLIPGLTTTINQQAWGSVEVFTWGDEG